MTALLIALVATAKLDAMDWHVRAGEAMLAVVLFRLLWGFLGSRNARFSSFVRGPRAVVAYARSLFSPAHARFAGHNPLGGWMVLLLLGLLLLQASLGLFSNDDIVTEGPLARYVSKDLSDALSSVHSFNAWVVVTLSVVHVAAVLAYWIRFKENLVRPMLVGVKELPGAAADDSAVASPIRAGALAGLCALAVWLLAR